MPRTEDIPGIEGEGVSQKKIPAVTKAATRYLEVRDQRMALTEKEVDAKAVLLNAMEENGLTIYRFDDHCVEVTSKKNVKVKSADDGEGSEDEE
jgi:UDP-N-acetylmuramyl pentapeptide synthase